MEKLDLTKIFRTYYRAGVQPEIATFSQAAYLSITGGGDPSTTTFSEKAGALYATAYGVKFACKALDKDFVVEKLEGLWWFDQTKYGGVSMGDAPLRVPRNEWQWRLLIRVPDYVTEEMVNLVVRKKNLPLADEVTLFTHSEGKVVQMLHVGPFSNEPATLRKMEEFMVANQL